MAEQATVTVIDKTYMYLENYNEMQRSLVGSEMCIRDSGNRGAGVR